MGGGPMGGPCRRCNNRPPNLAENDFRREIPNGRGLNNLPAPFPQGVNSNNLTAPADLDLSQTEDLGGLDVSEPLETVKVFRTEGRARSHGSH